MYDIVIIGAGIIGASIARELSKYNLNVAVLEKGSDVATGTSKANSGIVHSGFDAKHGSLKAIYNVMGNKMFDKLSKELEFPFKRCGSIITAYCQEDVQKLEQLKENGEKNGVEGLKIVFKDELKQLEPNISDKLYAGLYAPSGGIVCPYEMTIAFAENASINGVEFIFGCEVIDIKKSDNTFCFTTTKGKIKSRLLINAAGLFSDKINNILSEEKIEIIPRKGEYCLLDKTEGHLVNHTLFQLPTNMGKGVLITQTTDGNILIGPTSVDIEDKTNLATTKSGLDEIISKASIYVDNLPVRKIITSFTGLRAHSTKDDFIIEKSKDVEGLINVCGIESPGLTSAPAIALKVEELVLSLIDAQKNPNFIPTRKSIPHFRHMNNQQRSELIKKNPDYGHIICRCENVTKGEIIDAINSPLGAKNLDAIKRRTRMGMGRCQAGFCSMRILDIVADELDLSIEEVSKFGEGSELLVGINKNYVKD